MYASKLQLVTFFSLLSLVITLSLFSSELPCLLLAGLDAGWIDVITEKLL